MRRSIVLALAVVAIVLVVAAIAGRHALLRAGMSWIAGTATGYRVSIGEQRLGFSHGALLNVHVASDSGEPVLDARRVDVWYSLRDLLPGSRHRYGISAIAIDRPSLTLIKHRDGSYNVRFPEPAPAGPNVPSVPNAVPIALTIRVRDASGSVRAPYAPDPSARSIGIRNVSLDASINTAARTSYAIDGVFDEAVPQGFHAAGTVDVVRGFAMHHAYAGQIPLRAIGNFFINQDASRILAGTATHFDARAYALDVEPNVPVNYHLSASVDVRDAQIKIGPLAQSVDRLSGQLQFVDDALFTRSLRGMLAGVPVSVGGGIYQFAAPQFRLGIDGNGDLAQLRRIMSFSATQPISGLAHIGALVEGSLSSPAIEIALNAPRASYQNIPLQRARAFAGISNGVVTIAPLDAYVGDAHFTVRGALYLGNDVLSQLALHVQSPASALPYADALLGDEPLIGDVVVHGTNTNFGGAGALFSAVDPQRMTAVFALAPNGILDVEPLWIHTPSAQLTARYELDRANDRSAFWVDASHVSLHAAHSAFDAAIPHMPPIEGTVDRALLAGGGRSGNTAAVGGTLSVRNSRIAGVDFSAIQTGFAGTVNGVSAQRVYAAGSWGAIEGTGAFSFAGFAVNGRYAGTLEGLRPFIGGVEAHGRVEGPAAVAYANGAVSFESPGLSLRGADVRGLPLTRAAGAADVSGGLLHVYFARAGIAGGDAVAAGDYATAPGARVRSPLQLVAAGMDGGKLHGIGVPLNAGVVSAAGTLAAGNPLPDFSGGVAVRDGRVDRFAVAGTGLVHVHGNGVDIRTAYAGLDATYANLDGNVSGLSSGTAAYAIRAGVAAGDLPSMLHAFGIPSYPTSGTFSGDFNIAGAGLNPQVRGPVAMPAGTVNGLPFTDLTADLTADRSGALARHGSVVVGTTHVAFAAGDRPQISGLLVRAPSARLSDFNNFFDTGDTLGGSGSMRFDVVSQSRRLSSNGAIDVRDFRYRTFPFGTVRASWSSARNMLRGSLDAGGDEGRLRASGSVAFNPSSRWQDVVADSRYAVRAKLESVDSSYWLAVLGFPDVPVSGRIDGDVALNGRYPALGVTGSASMMNGSLFRLPVDAFTVAVSAAGRRLRVDRATLEAPGLTASASGSLSLRGSDALDLDVSARSSDLAGLTHRWTGAAIPVSGAFEATGHITGSYTDPVIATNFDGTNVSAYGVDVPSLFGSFRLAGGRLELRNAGATFRSGDVSLAGTLPLELRPFGVGPADSPVSFDLAVDNLDPGVFDPLAGPGTKLGGRINGAVGIGGTVRAPRISGDFDLAAGSYVSDLERTPITEMTARLQFNTTGATVSRLSARLGTGTLDGQGSIAFPDRSKPLTFAVLAEARGAQLDLPQYGRGSLTGKIALRKTGEAPPVLSGKVDATDAVIPFAAFLGLSGGASSGASPAPGPPLDVAFDLDLSAGRNVRVRGSGLGAGLDIGTTGAVRLGGDLNAPTLEGRFDATSGTLTYFDRAFRVQSAYVVFNKGGGLIPVLHATGTTHVVNPDPDRARNPYGSADISIDVDGPIDNLKVAFDSNPPGYSKEQILALIAPFGGFIGGVGFDTNTANQQAATVPGSQPLPGLLHPTNYGTISLGQEAFNILNAQFTAGLFSPLESALSQGLGFNDISLTVDYYGNVGFSARKEVGRFVNFVYASTFGLPVRQSYGVQYSPSDATTAQLSFFFETGPQRLFSTPAGSGTTHAQLTTGLPLVGQSGFSFTLQRLFW